MKYKISDILEHQEWRRKLNSYDLKEIEFIDEKGNAVEISDKVYDEWRFTGLSNIDFVNFGFYWEGSEND